MATNIDGHICILLGKARSSDAVMPTYISSFLLELLQQPFSTEIDHFKLVSDSYLSQSR